jgi:3-oxoacyl-[acyl-carrier-protein] synthase II
MVNEHRRVVITGLGVISSIGIGKETFWHSLLNGQSGISTIERFDTAQFDVHIGGEVKTFQPNRFLHKKEIRRYGRATQFAIAATQLALADAGIALGKTAGSAIGVCLGTTTADSQAIEAFDDKVVAVGSHSGSAAIRSALQFPGCMIGTCLSSHFRLKGPIVLIPTACAAGNYAVAYASDLIRMGKCDVVIAGGIDTFSRYAFTGFNRMFAVAPERCQPFDLNRRGTIVSEGAGILILESLDGALERGVLPYAEVAGYGVSCDANHMTIPTVDGISTAIRRTLADAAVSSDEIDYISAHGTGTKANDWAECAAIINVFGKRSGSVPVSSIKSMLGHTMGAASALEAIACSLVIQDNRIPPTINFKTPDPACPVDCVANSARDSRVDVVLNNSFAFGGNNICTVLKRI